MSTNSSGFKANVKRVKHPPRAERGVTLVELMVALVIGLLVTLVVGTVFVQGSRAHAEDDRFARMIENGRFALDQITRDLRMISFWGEMLDPTSLTTALVAGEDCGIDLFNGTSAILFNNVHSSPATVQFDIDADDCPDVTGTVREGTSQLAIKHAAGAALTADQEDGIVYLRSNGTAGSLIDDAKTTALPAGFQDWQYTPSVYYISESDGTPMLCRTQMDGTALETITPDECLATGVEQLHVQFGIDSDSDGAVNRYLSNPTAAQMASAITARVYVLVRSDTIDPAYTNDKTYRLGDLDIAPGGDHYYRRVFSSTVKLRNPANLASLK